MFVTFRNNFEERIINTNQINAIFQTEDQKEPYFRVEYFGGGFNFHSMEWNGFFRGTPTLSDVWLALRYFERKNEEKNNGPMDCYIRAFVSCVARWPRSDRVRYVERRTRR